MSGIINGRLANLGALLSAVAVLVCATPAKADDMSYGVFLGPQLLFDVDTYTAWGGGLDVTFGFTYFKFALEFSDLYWDTDLAGGVHLPVLQTKWFVVPLRAGVLFKYLYCMPGSDKPEDGVLFPSGEANTDGVSALGAEVGAAFELKLGKRKKDSPRVFVGADFQVFNGFEYMSTHDVGWLTALNIVAGMRFF